LLPEPGDGSTDAVTTPARTRRTTMSGSATRGPDGPGNEEEDTVERTPRAGGDAEAAGSVEEREAVARDDDDTWSPDDER
jgi:hypothetical protein